MVPEPQPYRPRFLAWGLHSMVRVNANLNLAGGFKYTLLSILKVCVEREQFPVVVIPRLGESMRRP